VRRTTVSSGIGIVKQISIIVFGVAPDISKTLPYLFKIKMFSRGNQRNVKRNAREQRLQFMNSQAALIAQKKKEIEDKLALQQKETDPKESEKDNIAPVEEIVQ